MSTVALVGCGKAGKTHARVLSRRDGLKLAFLDRHLERAEGLSSMYGGSAYTDLDELLQTEDLKALHVLTGVESHFEIAQRALDSRVNVYVEKPITETRAEFDTLRRMADEAGLTFYPGFSSLGSTVVRRAMELVRSEQYGRLVTVHSDYNWTASDGGIPYGSPTHRAYSMRGGILQNLADHPAAILVHLMDDIVDYDTVRLRRSILPNDVHDVLHVVLRGVGQVGSFTMSFGHGNSRCALVCHLESATIELDLLTYVMTIDPSRGLPSPRKRLLAGIMSRTRGSIALASNAAMALAGRIPRSPTISGLITNFYEVIDGTSAPIVDMDRAALTVDLLDRIWDGEESAELAWAE